MHKYAKSIQIQNKNCSERNLNMIELKLDFYSQPIHISDEDVSKFENPIIFYLVNKQDKTPFYVSFVIINFNNKEMKVLSSYNENNIRIINEQEEIEKYTLRRTPHSTISLHKDEDFFTFMDEEEYFFYVNYKDLIMKVYTIEDLLIDTKVKFKCFSSTFFRDDSDPNYFFFSIVDEQDILHIYRSPLKLDEFIEFDTFQSQPSPPHTLRKYKNSLFLSLDFKNAGYLLQNKGKILDMNGLNNLIYRNIAKLMYSRYGIANPEKLSIRLLQYKHYQELVDIIKNGYKIKCLPGEILQINTQTKEKTYYSTSGSNPAHFEIDVEDDCIYTSSHNFFFNEDGQFYIEPAVIDKFKLVDSKLEHLGAFKYSKGYRYSSHKVFRYEGKPYICTIGQPNRLIFADATTMELLFYHDIGEDVLSDQTDFSSYLTYYGSMETDIVGFQVSPNGESIIIIGPDKIYFYSFPERKIYNEIDLKSSEMLKQCTARTLHVDYLD